MLDFWKSCISSYISVLCLLIIRPKLILYNLIFCLVLFHNCSVVLRPSYVLTYFSFMHKSVMFNYIISQSTPTIVYNPLCHIIFQIWQFIIYNIDSVFPTSIKLWLKRWQKLNNLIDTDYEILYWLVIQINICSILYSGLSPPKGIVLKAPHIYLW